jgi:hypothetical protein
MNYNSMGAKKGSLTYRNKNNYERKSGEGLSVENQRNSGVNKKSP